MFRVGIGYDAHRFGEGIPLILGGVEIPYKYGLLGHSDGDVLSHSICDAILGALCLGDIGEHFPNTDERFRGIRSLKLLTVVNEMMNKSGYGIVNVDCVIIAQEPKISPFREEMRENVSSALSIPKERVSIKATTTEGLGFEGRKEGIASQSIVLLRRL